MFTYTHTRRINPERLRKKKNCFSRINTILSSNINVKVSNSKDSVFTSRFRETAPGQYNSCIFNHTDIFHIPNLLGSSLS